MLIERLKMGGEVCVRLLSSVVDSSCVVHISLACSARELIVTEPHAWICGSSGSGVRCFEVLCVAEGRMFSLSYDTEHAVDSAKLAPFKPMRKPLSVIHAKDKVQSFEVVPQVRSVKGPGVSSGDAAVIEDIAPKRQRGDDGVAIAVESEEVDADGGDAALRQFLDVHGLVEHDGPKGGCCLFHCGHLMKIAKRPVRAMLSGMWLLTRWSSTLMVSTLCGMEICQMARLLRIGRPASSKSGWQVNLAVNSRFWRWPGHWTSHSTLSGEDSQLFRLAKARLLCGFFSKIDTTNRCQLRLTKRQCMPTCPCQFDRERIQVVS